MNLLDMAMLADVRQPTLTPRKELDPMVIAEVIETRIAPDCGAPCARCPKDIESGEEMVCRAWKTATMPGMAFYYYHPSCAVAGRVTQRPMEG